jgi:hypothetical protein
VAGTDKLSFFNQLWCEYLKILYGIHHSLTP